MKLMMSCVDVPGRKISAMPACLSPGMSAPGMMRADGVVCARKDRKADYVNVFLNGGGGDHLGGLAQAGVDNFHACIA